MGIIYSSKETPKFCIRHKTERAIVLSQQSVAVRLDLNLMYWIVKINCQNMLSFFLKTLCIELFCNQSNMQKKCESLGSTDCKNTVIYWDFRVWKCALHETGTSKSAFGNSPSSHRVSGVHFSNLCGIIHSEYMCSSFPLLLPQLIAFDCRSQQPQQQKHFLGWLHWGPKAREPLFVYLWFVYLWAEISGEAGDPLKAPVWH